MAITTTCAGCGKTLAVADEYAGRQARCPECGHIYTVPGGIGPGGIGPGGIGPGGLGPGGAASSQESPRDFKSTLNPQPPSGSFNSEQEATAPLDLGNPLSMDSSRPAPPRAPSGIDLGSLSPTLYWMRATDGVEYGPADSATLSRWFAEGRVGPSYQIRAGEQGIWQPAATFRRPGSPNLDTSAPNNPFAAQSTSGSPLSSGQTYPKVDQSGLVLAMGILTWIGFCPIFGIIAWVIGGQALKDMQQGTADPTTRGLVQVGYYLGMINVILWVCCMGFFFLSVAVSVVVGTAI